MAAYDVVIVGAGVSGLYAGHTFAKAHPQVKVLILEANDYVGGRIKTDETFAAPLRLPLGAEFIHHEYEGHLLREYIAEKKFPTEDRFWPNYYWYSGESAFVIADERPEVNEMMETLAKLKREEIPAGVETLLEFLKVKGFSQTQINSVIPLTNDWAGPISRIGLSDMIEFYKNEIWNDEGEKYSLFSGGAVYSDLTDSLAKGLNIKLNWPVTNIIDKGDHVKVIRDNGELITCRKLILSVSVNVLKSDLIHFDPPLSPKKRSILQNVEMANIAKGHFIFSKPFWIEKYPKMWDVCCVGPVLVPEIWLRSDEKGHYITCYVTTEYTTVEGSYEELQLLQAMEEQLNVMFACALELRPASKHLLKRKITDWGRNKYVRGAYVYPSIGVEVGDKDILAESQGNLFFCGEAMHEVVDPCTQAAMATGKKAATDVFSSLQRSKL